MKYLINRKTKEHRIPSYCADPKLGGVHGDWRVVEADSEGWIKHEGNECPLPDGCLHEVKFENGEISRDNDPDSWYWVKNGSQANITHYRPLLEPEKVQEPEPTKPKRLFDDLLERLEASHAAAQALPDLVEQLRDRLKPMGLSVMYLSEFDVVEPEPAVETPQDNKYAAEW